MESLTLLSGDTMPVVGLGTWPMRGNQCKQVIRQALELGYTHFDTAWIYQNQREIGEALREAGADRSQLFITSKVGRDYLQYDVALKQADDILEYLQMDYVDLLLVHWPNETVPMAGTIRAFNEVFDAGKARSIGVSNFSVEQMERARSLSAAPISVNQIKYHPGYEQRDVLQWCLENDVVVTAYSPLGKKRYSSGLRLAEYRPRPRQDLCTRRPQVAGAKRHDRHSQSEFQRTSPGESRCF